MKVTQTPLRGVVVIEPKVFGDARGFFLEVFHEERYRRDAGITLAFVQDNHSRSKRGVLRGLHFQRKYPQGKLVRVASGRVWDVAVDIDPASPTFRRWFGIELSDDNHRQLYVPPGCAHGFVVLSDVADLVYKCTDFYRSEDETGVRWDDPELSISWPVVDPVLSDRDAKNRSLRTFLEDAERGLS